MNSSLSNIVTPLLNWYHTYARTLPWRQSPSAYHIWVSEIMLQQTRVEAVKAYYNRFTAELPTIADLAACQEEKLLKLWEGLGYYNRVRNMQKAAIQVMTQYHGEMPHSYEELLKLPGIGSYTAGAVASIAYGIPVPAVDGNVLRVITRMTANYGDITKQNTKDEITKQLQAIMPKQHAGDFNQALMELGATVCIPNGEPQCFVCPVQTYCKAFQDGLTTELPIKSKKKPRRIENKTVLLLISESAVALQKRDSKQVLAGLWQFPNVEGHLSPHAVQTQIDQWHIPAKQILESKQSKHIFTHIEWHMNSYLIFCEAQAIDLCDQIEWMEKQDLEHIAIPTAFQPFVSVIKTYLEKK